MGNCASKKAAATDPAKPAPGAVALEPTATALEPIATALEPTATAKLYPFGSLTTDVVAQSEDGWILKEEAWLSCAGGEEKLGERVKATDKGRVVEVGLNFCQELKALPASISHLRALRAIDLAGCWELVTLPPEIGGCVALQTLSLAHCGALSSLPPEIGGCAKLKELNLSACAGLTSLPAELGGCAALEMLCLNECKALTTLPQALGRCAALNELVLSGCKSLISLPDLSKLEKLTVEGVSKDLQPWKENGRKAYTTPAALEAEAEKRLMRSQSGLGVHAARGARPTWKAAGRAAGVAAYWAAAPSRQLSDEEKKSMALMASKVQPLQAGWKLAKDTRVEATAADLEGHDYNAPQNNQRV